MVGKLQKSKAQLVVVVVVVLLCAEYRDTCLTYYLVSLWANLSVAAESDPALNSRAKTVRDLMSALEKFLAGKRVNDHQS